MQRIELPALVCFPLLLFSNAVLYHIVMSSCSRIVALLLAVLSDCPMWDMAVLLMVKLLLPPMCLNFRHPLLVEIMREQKSHLTVMFGGEVGKGWES